MAAPWIAPAVGLATSFMGSRSKPPTFNPAAYGYNASPQTPNLQAPGRVQFDPNSLFKPGSSQLAQYLGADVSRMANGGTALSPAYTTAVRSRANTGLGLARDRANESAAFDANRFNLLGSGSLAVRQSRNDEEYQRGMQNVEDNLVQREFDERQRTMEMLRQMLGMEADVSNNAARYGMEAGRLNQAADLAFNGNLLQLNGQNVTQNGQNLTAAQNAYNADLKRWEAKRANDGNFVKNLGALASYFF